MEQNTSPKVWYASEKRIKSATKFIVFDDTGTLKIGDKTIEFTGPKNTISINKSSIKNIALVRQGINWITYGGINVIAFLYISLGGNPWDTTVLFYLLIGNIAGLAIGMNTKWVAITYSENGAEKKVHFASADMAGWSGMFGGTQKIYDSLKK